MSKLTKMTSAVAAAGVGLAMLATPIVAQAKEVHIKVQAVIGTQTTEVKMLRDFMDDVTALTGGEVTFEVLPAGAVVGVKETLDAVDAGLVDGGFAWTHYWSGKHPAAHGDPGDRPDPDLRFPANRSLATNPDLWRISLKWPLPI